MSKTFFKKQEELLREIKALTASTVEATGTKRIKSFIIQNAIKQGWARLTSDFLREGPLSSNPHFTIVLTDTGQERVANLVEDILPHTPNDIFWVRNGTVIMQYLGIAHLAEYIIHPNDQIRKLALTRYDELMEEQVK